MAAFTDLPRLAQEQAAPSGESHPPNIYNPGDDRRVLSNTYDPARPAYATIGTQHNQSQLYGAGQWVPRTGVKTDEYVQIDCTRPVSVCGVVTQGRGDGEAQNWVKEYTVSTSLDGQTFVPVQEGFLFSGNFDRTTPVTNRFPRITARYVRISPKAWHNYISLRAGLLIQFQ